MVGRRVWWWRWGLGALAAMLAIVVAACRGRVREAAPQPAPELSAALVIARNATSLMSIPGVVGVYEGASGGQTVLRVMVLSKADSTVRRIPKTLEGYPVEIEVTGPIKPMGH